MSKTIPTIQKYMTVLPHTIGHTQSISSAKKIMSEYQIRHLPVLEHGKIIGVISDRDIRLLTSLKGVDPNQVSVNEGMSPDPFIVSPESPLDEVAQEMSSHKYGCAVVVQNEHVVGIFTTINALQALVDLLHTRLQ